MKKGKEKRRKITLKTGEKVLNMFLAYKESSGFAPPAALFFSQGKKII